MPVRSLDLDAAGRISALLVGTPQSTVRYASLDEVVTALKALPGQTSLLVTRQTTHASKQATGAAAELTQLATRLAELIKRFKAD